MNGNVEFKLKHLHSIRAEYTKVEKTELNEFVLCILIDLYWNIKSFPKTT